MQLKIVGESTSRTESDTSNPEEEMTVEFLIQHSDNTSIVFSVAKDFAERAIPRSRRFLRRNKIDFADVDGSLGKVYSASATYLTVKLPAPPSGSGGEGDPDNPEDKDRVGRGGFISSINAATETVHTTQSIETVHRVNIIPRGAPDQKSGIGYDGEKYDGVDYKIPILSFTYTVPIFSFDLKRIVIEANEKNAKVNKDKFIWWQPGELLMVGFSMSRQPDDAVIDFSFNIAALENGTLTIGGRKIKKRGWQYLWVLYAKKIEDGFLLAQPAGAYVEQIYKETKFNNGFLAR